MGYHRAGFAVVGVDVNPQPNYPFEFHQTDAMTFPLDGYDAIHASPPCQLYSALRNAAADRGSGHSDLVGPTRALLEATGLPWVMENVPGAPMAPAIVLCGSMFGLGAGKRQLRRHRLFESNVPMMQFGCQHQGEAIGVYGGGRTGRYTFGNGAHRDKYNRRGAYQGTYAEAREAMGIDWMRHGELTQAIPPAYTEHIGHYLLIELERRAGEREVERPNPAPRRMPGTGFRAEPSMVAPGADGTVSGADREDK